MLDWGGRLDVISKKIDVLDNLVKKRHKDVKKIDALETLVKKSQQIDSEEDKMPKKSDHIGHTPWPTV